MKLKPGSGSATAAAKPHPLDLIKVNVAGRHLDASNDPTQSFQAIEADANAEARAILAGRSSEPHFMVNGARYSRASMLAENADDEDFCQWLRMARVGEVWEQMHSERCECVAPEGFTEDRLLAGDLARAENKAKRFHLRNDARALDLQQQRLSNLGQL